MLRIQSYVLEKPIIENTKQNYRADDQCIDKYSDLLCFFPCFVRGVKPKDLRDEVEDESVLRHFEGSKEKAERREYYETYLSYVVPCQVFFHASKYIILVIFPEFICFFNNPWTNAIDECYNRFFVIGWVRANTVGLSQELFLFWVYL